MVVPSNSVDYWNNLSTLWTMCAFGAFYVIAPALYKMLTSYKRAIGATVIFTALSIVVGSFIGKFSVSYALSNFISYLSYRSTFVVMFEFVVGIMAYFATRNIREGTEISPISHFDNF